MLIIKHPAGYQPERSYIFGVLLGDFLGLEYRTKVIAGNSVHISCAADNSARELIMPDILFQTPFSGWPYEDSIPAKTVRQVSTRAMPQAGVTLPESIPLIFSNAAKFPELWKIKKNVLMLGLDIFGAAFWALTRFEELKHSSNNSCDCFPIEASWAFKAGMSERPFINEYLEVLWTALKYLWPFLQRKHRSSRIFLSHDVDIPLCLAGRSKISVARSLATDLFLRRDVDLAVRRCRSWKETKRGFFDNDPCNTFDFIMDNSEKKGWQSQFNFIAQKTFPPRDGNIDLELPWMRKLLRRINNREHLIGLHPSYRSLEIPGQIEREFHKLQSICREEGIEQSCWGGRQHYLRWSNPRAWQFWEQAGLDFDSSLGFSVGFGFRCGVCFEYQAFDLLTRKALNLRERPLIIMDGAIIRGWNFNSEKIFQVITDLSQICQQYAGDFSLLWHNSMLISKKQRHLFQRICECI